MADHHEAQDYKANGPTGIGFRTGGDGTGIANGVVAAGTEIGVHGIGLGIEGSNASSAGVVGEGGYYGVRGFSQNVVGVFGHSDAGTGVKGIGETGVQGTGGSVGAGVFGSTRENGTGVLGDSERGIGVDGHSANGSGIRGRSDTAYGGVFSSAFAQIHLEPALTSGPPTTGPHGKGEFFVDKNGSLFYCVGGSPPSWQRLAGPPLIIGISEMVSRILKFLRLRTP